MAEVPARTRGMVESHKGGRARAFAAHVTCLHVICASMKPRSAGKPGWPLDSGIQIQNAQGLEGEAITLE